MSGGVAKDAASLKMAIVNMKKVVKSRTINSSDGALPNVPIESPRKFDDTVPVALPSVYSSLPELVSNVDMK